MSWPTWGVPRLLGTDHPRNCECGHKHDKTPRSIRSNCTNCPCEQFVYKDWRNA